MVHVPDVYVSPVLFPFLRTNSPIFNSCVCPLIRVPTFSFPALSIAFTSILYCVLSFNPVKVLFVCQFPPFILYSYLKIPAISSFAPASALSVACAFTVKLLVVAVVT